MNGETAQALVKAELLAKYLNVSSCSILIYDFLLSLSDEISAIWLSSWSKMKLLYLFLRYVPLVNIVIVLFGQFAGASPQTCSNLYKSNTVILFFILCTTRVITAYRTWILWGKERRVSVWLSGFFCITWLGVMATTCVSLKSLLFNPATATGCISSSSSSLLSILFVNWALLVAFDTAILSLMVIRWYTAFTISGQSRLRDIITKDGVLYFVFLSLLPPVNLIAIICLPLMYINLLSIPELTLNCIIASRMIMTTVERKVESRRSIIIANVRL
ncbi:hypothetical protein BDQ17DRAFT_1363088 [Cyathus striatus]|nr:hypothetical protein BDQ17DRAFT_1363088 [Cyathus striatus]